MELLTKGDLLGREILVAVNRRPGWRRVPAAHKLLVNLLMASPAIARRQLGGNHEPVMVLAGLAFRRLMTFQAVDALLGMHAQLVLMHHGILLIRVALGTFARSPDQGRTGLLGNHPRSKPVHNKSGHQNRRAD